MSLGRLDGLLKDLFASEKPSVTETLKAVTGKGGIDLKRLAVRYMRATDGDNSPELAEASSDLLRELWVVARNRFEAGDHEAAYLLHREALEVAADSLGRGHPDYAIHLNSLALVLKAQGKLDEAEPLYREALKIYAETTGTRHPNYATRLNSLALLLTARGRLDEAEPMMAEALEIREASLPPEHPNIRQSREELTLIRTEIARRDAAE